MAPSAQMEITVPSASTVTPPTGKAFTSYSIACRLPLRTYTVNRRYSEFVTLHSTLTSQALGGSSPPYQLPPKHWFKSTFNNPDLTEERRRGLEAYLRGILTDADPRWRDTAAWRSFLNLPASSTASGGHTARGSLHGSLTTPADGDKAVSDPTVWLDTHRELLATLQSAREHLAARHNATGTRAQQEEGAAAKKQLVRAGTLLNALDRGLSSGGNAGDFATPRLGDGEMRRRRDLLSAARRERERLEELQANIGRKENISEDVRSMEREGERNGSSPGSSLFNASGSGSGGGSGGSTSSNGKRGIGKGRVIGRETAKTRELENTGVLQLQQQMMKEQDDDVNLLRAAVRRQRELATQINEELEVQNEMLTMLDEDVDRLGGKVKVARKRVDKIS